MTEFQRPATSIVTDDASPLVTLKDSPAKIRHILPFQDYSFRTIPAKADLTSRVFKSSFLSQVLAVLCESHYQYFMAKCTMAQPSAP